VTNGAVSNLRLEVALDTKPKGGGQLAIAQTLFPKTEYKVYASANITAGLNASLGFDVPLKPNGQPWITTAQLSADIKGGFVFGPFEYSFKKCAVMGAGEGASTVDWKITKSDLLDGGSFHAWLVLKVPKGRKSIWVTARMETTLTIPHFPFPIHKMLPSDDKDYELALV
jgi:hypothetical protein